MMAVYDYQIENEFNAVETFLREKYGVNIKAKEQLASFTQACLFSLLSFKIWKKRLCEHFSKTPKIDMYFQEMISNIIHIMILGALDMKIPALVMLRRTQEIILKYLFYSEHPVEMYKKEADDSIRNMAGFDELKDYIKNYPFSMKYRIKDQDIQPLVSDIISNWANQYKELSNYVHGTNTQYFQGVENLNGFRFEKKDVNFLCKEIKKLTSIGNSLFIIFYFEEYVAFDENTEKSLIRKSIENQFNYKDRIVKILNEI